MAGDSSFPIRPGSGGFSCSSCKASRIARYISTGSHDRNPLIWSIARNAPIGGRAGIIGSSISDQDDAISTGPGSVFSPSPDRTTRIHSAGNGRSSSCASSTVPLSHWSYSAGWRIAPFAGAWIETRPLTSHSRRGRVAPFAGAWIETTWPRSPTPPMARRPLRGGVDRNTKFNPRELMRGSRPLRGGVDRNVVLGAAAGDQVVAPFAGAWIETGNRRSPRATMSSPPSRGRGSKQQRRRRRSRRRRVGRTGRSVMSGLVSGQTLTCELTGEQTYDREVGTCYLPTGGDVTAILIERGVCGGAPAMTFSAGMPRLRRKPGHIRERCPATARGCGSGIGATDFRLISRR